MCTRKRKHTFQKLLETIFPPVSNCMSRKGTLNEYKSICHPQHRYSHGLQVSKPQEAFLKRVEETAMDFCRAPAPMSWVSNTRAANCSTVTSKNVCVDRARRRVRYCCTALQLRPRSSRAPARSAAQRSSRARRAGAGPSPLP